MIEECVCCGAFAPSWEAEEYAGWELEMTADGAYLGVVCPGCFAGEELAFLGAAPPRPALVVLQGRGEPAAGASRAEAA